MRTYRARPIDATKILTRRELAAVLNDLKRKATQSKNTRMNLALFRLACCCGLRASEIANLQVGDVRTELARPHIRIRNGASKGGRSRVAPRWGGAGGGGARGAPRSRRPLSGRQSRSHVIRSASASARRVRCSGLLDSRR